MPLQLRSRRNLDGTKGYIGRILLYVAIIVMGISPALAATKLNGICPTAFRFQLVVIRAYSQDMEN